MLPCLFDLEAKPGKEAEVGSFLRSGLPLVEEEPATVAWFRVCLDASKKRFEIHSPGRRRKRRGGAGNFKFEHYWKLENITDDSNTGSLLQHVRTR
jgi:hypothetical protein